MSGAAAATLALIGSLILLQTTAWEVATFGNKLYTGLLFSGSLLATLCCLIHFGRQGRIDGILSGLFLFALGVYPFVSTTKFLFFGPSYGGLIGGVGAAIAFAVFLISLTVTISGIYLFIAAIKTEK